jgi:Spy/CpxP family protein refolding chaperone
MARLLTWMLLTGFLGSASAGAAPLCEQQRGDGTKPAARQDEGPPRWKWWLHPDSRKELRLTDLQSKKIDEIWEATAPKQREKWQEIERLEDTLATTIKENTADVAIVAQQVEKVEKLRAENTAARTVMLYRMRLLLTPEQRVKVDEMRARMDAERKKQEEDRKRQGRGDKY